MSVLTALLAFVPALVARRQPEPERNEDHLEVLREEVLTLTRERDEARETAERLGRRLDALADAERFAARQLVEQRPGDRLLLLTAQQASQASQAQAWAAQQAHYSGLPQGLLGQLGLGNLLGQQQQAMQQPHAFLPDCAPGRGFFLAG